MESKLGPDCARQMKNKPGLDTARRMDNEDEGENNQKRAQSPTNNKRREEGFQKDGDGEGSLCEGSKHMYF